MRRFQALKNAKRANGRCSLGQATQDASQKRGEPEAPRAPQRLQDVLEAIIDTPLSYNAKPALKC